MRRAEPLFLGDFRLIEPIGRGGLGEVHSAVHRSGLEVAVKLTLSAQARERTVREALEREVRAAARLGHPNAIRLYETGVVEDTVGPLVAGAPYLVMERCTGNLAQLRPDVSALMGILDDLLSALAHAHARGLVHRDVKPSNVLIASDGRPVLSDFGLASPAGVTDLGGTPGYMAPEQLEGRVDRTADLYALGTLAWVLIRGRAPWEVRGLGEPLPALAPECGTPEALDRWIARMTASEPGERFPFAADARHALAAISLDAGPGAAVEVRPTRSVRPMTLPGTLSRFLTAHDVTRPAPVLDPIRHVEPAPIGAAPPLPEWPPEVRSPPPPRGLGLSLVGLREHPVVGRATQKAALWSAIRDLAQGRSSVIELSGLPGSGRRHLAAWATHVAHEHGVAVPFDTELQDVDAIVRAMTVAAGERALVWPMAGSRRRVDRVLAHPMAPPVLAVCAAEPGTEGALELGPLPRHELGHLVEGVLGLRGSAADRVAERAHGNPGLAVALVRDGADSGRIEAGDLGFEVRADLDVPSAALELAGRHLDRIASRGLQVAGFLGARFTGDTARALGTSDAELADLELQGVLEPDGRDGWRFTSAALAEAARARIPERRLPTLVQALSAHFESIPNWRHDASRVVQLARASADCGDLDRAIELLFAAGQAARKQGDPARGNTYILEQRKWMERAAVPARDVRWFESALQLASSAVLLYRYDEAEHWLAEAERAIDAHGHDSRRHAWMAARGRLEDFRGNPVQAMGWYRRAEISAREAGDGNAATYQVLCQGHMHLAMGQIAQAMARYEQAEREYADSPDHRDRRSARLSWITAAEKPGSPVTLDDAVLDAALAEAAGTPQNNVVVTLYLLRGHRRADRGDFEQAEADYQEALARIVQLGSRRLPIVLLVMARLRGLQGRWSEAREAWVEIEPMCSGMYASMWGVGSLAAFALDPDFDDRLAEAVRRVESAELYDAAHLPNLEIAAARAAAGGRVDRATAIRAVAERWRARVG